MSSEGKEQNKTLEYCASLMVCAQSSMALLITGVALTPVAGGMVGIMAIVQGTLSVALGAGSADEAKKFTLLNLSTLGFMTGVGLLALLKPKA